MEMMYGYFFLQRTCSTCVDPHVMELVLFQKDVKHQVTVKVTGCLRMPEGIARRP
jgi:hypothetical protein